MAVLIVSFFRHERKIHIARLISVSFLAWNLLNRRSKLTAWGTCTNCYCWGERSSTPSSWNAVFSPPPLDVTGETLQSTQRNVPSDSPFAARNEAAVKAFDFMLDVSILLNG